MSRVVTNPSGGFVRHNTMPRPSWKWADAAACRGMDIDLFFAREGEAKAAREARDERARQVCMGCPVRTECLDHAVAMPERYGVWGGQDEDQRVGERRRRQRRANAA